MFLQVAHTKAHDRLVFIFFCRFNVNAIGRIGLQKKYEIGEFCFDRLNKDIVCSVRLCYYTKNNVQNVFFTLC